MHWDHNQYATEVEVRLALIKDRLTRHVHGVPVTHDVVDFEAYAADDIQYLLDLLDEAEQQAGEIEQERRRDRVTYHEEAQRGIKKSSDLMDEAASTMMSVEHWFQRSMKQLNLLKADEGTQLAAIQNELNDTKQRLRQTEDDQTQDKREIAQLKAKLAGLPPTWLERIQKP